MSETIFDELKRYVRFDDKAEAALRATLPLARPHFKRVVDAFYDRLSHHEEARRVFTGPEQVERLKGTLHQWLELLFAGPWDDAYWQRRARIGRMHVQIALPQRYMFGAMNVVREALIEMAEREITSVAERADALSAIHKILDIELAIMLETYREAIVDVRTRRAERLASLGTMAAGLAHELRNPLNAAHLQLNVAQRRLQRMAGQDADKARVAVDLADGEMKRLAGLVEDFLQFAKPQPLRTSVVDLRVVADVIVSLMRPEAKQRGVRLSLERGTPVMAEVDEEKIKQVLLNLIRNAIDVSKTNDEVSVRVEHVGESAHLMVFDSGPGVAPNAPIFEPFFTTKDSGTGLGLAIVHRVVLDHGGTVNVDSAPGRTVFRVVLPQRMT